MNCRKKQVEQIKCKECLGCKPNQDVWACWVGCYSMVNFSWLSSLIYWPLQKKVNGMGGCCPVVSQLQACPAHRWFGHPLPSTQTAGSGGDPVLQSLSCSASGFAAKNHVCTGTSSVAGAAVGTPLAPDLGGAGVQPSSPGTCKEGSVSLALTAHGLPGSSCLKLAPGSFLSASGLKAHPLSVLFFATPYPDWPLSFAQKMALLHVP